jgi:hypothetical protein
VLLPQLAEAAGNLGEVASLEQPEEKVDAAIAPAVHQNQAAEEEGRADTPEGLGGL